MHIHEAVRIFISYFLYMRQLIYSLVVALDIHEAVRIFTDIFQFADVGMYHAVIKMVV